MRVCHSATPAQHGAFSRSDGRTAHDPLLESQQHATLQRIRRPCRRREGSRYWRVNDGIRTRDRWSHNPVLYRLSYVHHASPESLLARGDPPPQARLGGFEPPAHGLEVRCSIHLSYRRLHHPEPRTGGTQGAGDGIRTRGRRLGRPTLYQLSYTRPLRLPPFHSRSGREDSNLRPSAPKADALPGCATSRRNALQHRKRNYSVSTVRFHHDRGSSRTR